MMIIVIYSVYHTKILNGFRDMRQAFDVNNIYISSVYPMIM